MSPPSLDYMQHADMTTSRRYGRTSSFHSGLDPTETSESSSSLLSCGYRGGGVSLLELAHREIAELRAKEEQQQRADAGRQCPPVLFPFPPACFAVVSALPGNLACVDCGSRNPQWATVSYGALVCLHCSGHHRSLGCQVSSVRSLSMDDWSVPQILCMLEGGNRQVRDFFARHLLCQDTASTDSCINKTNVIRLRYKTKAALFYRQQMELHIRQVLEAGPYQGRSKTQQKRRKQNQASLRISTSTLE